MSYKRAVFIAIFLLGAGLIVGLTAPNSVDGVISQDITALQELSDILGSLPSALIAVIIFVKNASVLVLSFAFSPLLCLMPILSLTVNGWLIAFVSTAVVQERSVGFLLAGLLPHGIFELPALILGQAAALCFGTTAMLALFKKEKRNLLLPSLKKNLRYVMIAVGLLIPAAIIETYVTPLFLT